MPKLPKQIEIETFVNNGKFSRNREDIVNAVEQYEGKEIIFCLKRNFKKRSDNQNRYYWGVIVEHWKHIIREEWGEVISHENTHEFLKTNLNYEEYADEETGEIMLNPITGIPIRKPKSTTENTTYTQEEYHDACRQLAYEMFNYEIPLPERKLKVNF